MTERFIIDDAGTLIDIETRNTYDYVSEIRPVLNELHDENMKLKWILRHYNPQDFNWDFDDEKFKEQMELFYSTKEFLDD